MDLLFLPAGGPQGTSDLGFPSRQVTHAGTQVRASCRDPTHFNDQRAVRCSGDRRGLVPRTRASSRLQPCPENTRTCKPTSSRGIRQLPATSCRGDCTPEAAKKETAACDTVRSASSPRSRLWRFGPATMIIYLVMLLYLTLSVLSDTQGGLHVGWERLHRGRGIDERLSYTHAAA